MTTEAIDADALNEISSRLEDSSAMPDDDDDHGVMYTPTPEQIAEGCRQIQAGWSAETELSRRSTGRPRDVYLGGVVRTGD